jgi:hypothetical protein
MIVSWASPYFDLDQAMRSDQSLGDATAKTSSLQLVPAEKSPRNFGRHRWSWSKLTNPSWKKIFLPGRTCPMISLEDCIGMCGLDPDEVAAIGEHEHIPDIAAAALADYLLKQAGGPERIRAMIVDDIHKALDAGHIRHGAELFMALRHFLEQHPEANPELGN